MNRVRGLVCLLVGVWVLVLGLWLPSYGQSQEVKQLLLNVEKLSQMKNILRDMKKGYQVVSSGYRSVKNIAEGNFSLHKVFLDGLMVVSPAVKRYARVADIISDQQQIVKEYKQALRAFRSADVFAAGELAYMESVYGNLFALSLQNLDDLAMVITSDKLRMSDDERLRAIDRIFADTRDKLSFLRDFNSGVQLLLMQKRKEKRELEQLGSFYR